MCQMLNKKKKIVLFPSISNLALEFTHFTFTLWNAYCTSSNVSLLHFLCWKICWYVSSHIHVYHLKVFQYILFFSVSIMLFILLWSLTAAYLESMAICSSWKSLCGRWENMLHLCFAMYVCVCEREREREREP